MNCYFLSYDPGRTGGLKTLTNTSGSSPSVFTPWATPGSGKHGDARFQGVEAFTHLRFPPGLK